MENIIDTNNYARIIYPDGKTRFLKTVWSASSSEDCFPDEAIVPTYPIVEEPIKTQATLKTTYFGERMSPTLRSGDRVILNKIENKAIIEWGEIHMIQVDVYNVFCRVHRGVTNDQVTISYDNPEDTTTQQIPIRSIEAMWKLAATARIN